MLKFQKSISFFEKYIYPIGIILFNLFYFFPHTIKWLFWEYYPGEGYGVLITVVCYVFHTFFIFSCVFLFQKASRVKLLCSLFLSSLVILISEVFAFRDVQPLLCLFSISYIFI